MTWATRSICRGIPSRRPRGAARCSWSRRARVICPSPKRRPSRLARSAIAWSGSRTWAWRAATGFSPRRTPPPGPPRASAPALWILGLAAVALAVTRGGRWALLAAAGGAAFACGLTLPALVRRHARRPGARAVDFSHTIDLLRRAHDAHACWAVGLRDGDVESLGEREVHEDRRRRGAALAQLASVDGRVHVAREPHGTYVAVGDF